MQSLPSLQPCGSRRGSYKGHFWRDSTAHSPHHLRGLGRHRLANSPAGKVALFQVFKTRKPLFPRGTDNKVQCSKLSADSYKIFLLGGNGYTGALGQWGYTIATQIAKSSKEKCKRTPNKLLRNCHCLVKAAGQFWKESFTPHLKFPQRTQTHILKYIKHKDLGGQGTIPLVFLPWQQWKNTPESVIKKRTRKKIKGRRIRIFEDREKENLFRKTQSLLL